MSTRRRFLDVGTWNVQRDVPASLGVPAVLDLLDVLDVLALQEGDALRDELRDAVDRRTWSMTRGARPILYRHGVLQLDQVDAVRVADGRRVGYVPGRRSVLPDYYVTRARFTGRWSSTPERLTVFNVHAPAHSRWGGPRGAMWSEFERNVARLVAREHHESGATSLALGDWNRPMPGGRFPGLRGAGARSCWDGDKHPPATHGRDTIDGGWILGGRLTSPAVMGRRVGDHRAVHMRLVG